MCMYMYMYMYIYIYVYVYVYVHPDVAMQDPAVPACGEEVFQWLTSRA